MRLPPYLFLVLMALATAHTTPPVPDDWLARQATGNMLAAATLPTNLAYMPYIGNGYLSTVMLSDTLYVAGLFNGYATRDPTHRARIPSSSNIVIANADPDTSVYAIDFELGVFYQRLTVGGGTASVEQRWFASRYRPHVIVVEIDVTGPTTLKLTMGNGSASSDLNWGFVPSGVSGVVLRSGTTAVAEEDDTPVVGVSVAYTDLPSTGILVVPAGKHTYRFFTTVYLSVDGDLNGLSTSQAATAEIQRAQTDAESLLAEHVEFWSMIWQSGMSVDGDLELAHAVNSSLYYILSSIREDVPRGLSPGSLSSNSYNGHSFWDCETWMYPTVAVFWPGLARSLLEYRQDRMAGAEKKALSYGKGYTGLLYPWESAQSGEEVTPSWAATGQREIHINGDISLAARQYWYLTHDEEWLKAALPMLTGIADFWVSRVTNSSDDGSLSIIDVIPPDEYADHVTDSVYTNSVAKISLEFAEEALEYFGQTEPMYLKVASSLRILFDESLDIHPEYQGYDGRTIKQADVVLLGYPLQVPMVSDIRINDLLYYLPKTDENGPAMTHSMHAIAWIEMGATDNASSFFRRGYANVRPPFDVWSETPTGGAVNFITGAGGFLQSVWAGYAGLRVTSSTSVSILPTCPPAPATSITLRGLRFFGASLDLSFNTTSCSLVMNSPPDPSIAPRGICLDSNEPLISGEPASCHLRSSSLLKLCNQDPFLTHTLHIFETSMTFIGGTFCWCSQM